MLLSGCVNELYVITDARVTAARKHARARRRYLGYGTRVHNAQTRVMYMMYIRHITALFMELWPWRVKGRGICRVQPPSPHGSHPSSLCLSSLTPKYRYKNNSFPDTRAAFPLIAIKAFDLRRINLSPRSRLSLTMYLRKFDLCAYGTRAVMR